MAVARNEGMTVPQILSLIVGIAFLAAGVIGFFVTGFENFFSETNETLFGLEINGLHNTVHLLYGAAGIGLAMTLAGARTFGWFTFVAYAAFFVYGLFAVGSADLNYLSMNSADNWFHLTTAIVGLVIALYPVDRTVTTTVEHEVRIPDTADTRR